MKEPARFAVMSENRCADGTRNKANREYRERL
jgi:hypothetical protein